MGGVTGGDTRVRVATLGPLEVRVAGETVALPPAQRRLLSILVMEADRDVSTDELIDRMWPDGPPATARTAIQVHVSGLRRSVPIASTSTGYRLASDEVDHDRGEFERLVAQAGAARAASDWAAAHGAAAAAQSLWRGDPLPDLAGDLFASPVAGRLQELALGAADLEVEALLALGRNAAAIHRLHELIERHPLHDRLRHHLMLALYRSGRQGEALLAYRSYRTLLGESMGIEPGAELRRLEEQILVHDPALGAGPVPHTPHNLVEVPTSFVGREPELRRIAAELVESRVVTISGPPGMGKTRLAAEVARSLLGSFDGGVWWSELAGASGTRAVVATVAAVTSAGDGIDRVERLADALRSRPILLVLDNGEHVIEVVRRLVVALTSAPGACSVLVTSRQPLGVHGERVHRLDPLPIAPESAVALLADRVRAVDRGFAVTPENIDTLLDLCRRLEGIPLGIELVARYVPVLGLGDTARLLDTYRSDDALVSAFEWSTGLLADQDRRMLERLAVFESSFTLERADAVCGDGTELATAGSISRLVDASLLGLDWSAGAARYRMLQPVRELAWQKVDDDERGRLARRHAGALVRASEGLLEMEHDERQGEALRIVDGEIADHRRALGWLREHRQWDGMATVLEALAPYWYARFLGWEGRSWIDELPTDELPARDRARVDRVAGFLAWAVHDYQAADEHYGSLHRIGVSTGDTMAEADALYGRGLIHQKRRFLDGAAMLEDAARLYESMEGCERQLGQCLLFRGLDEAYNGDVAAAESLLARAVGLLTDVGHLRQVSKAERWLAHCAWRRGDGAGARAHADRAEELARTLDDRIALGGALVEQAHIDIDRGSVGTAAAHLAEALAPIPAVDEIDVCQVLIPVGRLALRLEQPELAAAIVAHIDDVYDRHGWRPFDGPAAAELRGATGGIEAHGGDLLTAVSALLGAPR